MDRATTIMAPWAGDRTHEGAQRLDLCPGTSRVLALFGGQDSSPESRMGGLIVWDLADPMAPQELARVYNPDFYPAAAIFLDPDRVLFGSIRNRGKLHVLDVGSGEITSVPGPSPRRLARLSPDQVLLDTPFGPPGAVYAVGSAEPRLSFERKSQESLAELITSPDGKWALLSHAQRNGKLRVYEVATGKQAGAIPITLGAKAAFAPDSTWFAYGGCIRGAGQRIVLHGTGEGFPELGSIDGLADPFTGQQVVGLAVEPNGERIVVSMSKVLRPPGALFLLDVTRRAILADIPDETAAFGDVVFAPKAVVVADWGRSAVHVFRV